MINKFVSYILTGTQYTRKHPQVVITILLTLGIPFAFIFSGQQFLKASNANQETLLLERVGTLQDIFVRTAISKNVGTELNSDLLYIATQNKDIKDFAILKETEGKLTIVSSMHETDVGIVVDEATQFKASRIHSDRSLVQFSAVDGIRYVDAYRSFVHSDSTYYIYTNISLEHLDETLSSRVREAYMWLAVILIILMYLLMRHVRLIDYAYLYNEVRKSNEMKDMFTNMIAHELRAPLTAMRGYASIIRERDNSSQTKANATKIEDSSNRLLLIVNDLLDVARIHSGKLSVQSTRTNIQSVVNSVLEVMEAPAQEKNITLDQEGLRGDIFITGDEKRLFQAFTNLVSNSIKYTKSGRIIIGIKERNERVEIRVMDTGMGISAENQKNLFAPFFRVENTETEGTVGTGLGMWITKQLIELMNGSIGVESIRGVGTHIVVTLPK